MTKLHILQILRDNKYEELYANNFDILDKMGRLLERHNQEEIDNYIALYLLMKLNLLFEKKKYSSPRLFYLLILPNI